GGAQPLVDFMNKDHMITFLMGLNEQYSQVRGHILLMDPLPNISVAYSMILQEEKQREVGSSQLSNALGKQKTTDLSQITPLQQFACAIQAIAAG
ncbi:receptor-like serine/threonine kinase, partial [Trifolium medium]|nr:receptor-like serine/threonine kinase [Trifolium medium]